ncbi:MAG TPA: hypothetical protein VGL18_02280 [Actinomycetota bacterium]
MVLALGVLVFALTLLVNGGTIYSSDGISTYEVAKSVVEDGDVAITHGVVWQGRDGRYYSPFGIGQSLIALPVYFLIRPISELTSEPERVAQAGVAALMPLIAALISVAMYRLARRLGGNQQSSAVVAVGAVAGTFLLAYSKDFLSEPLTTLFVVLAVERALAGRPVASGAAAAGALVTRPQFLAFAPLFLWRTQRDGGWPAFFRAIAPLSLGLLIDLGYNVLRFGSPTNFGYSDPNLKQGFTTPFYEGAAGLLFHPQKSIFLFAPIVFLLVPALRRLWATQRSGFWLLTGNLAITFTLSATWWDWGGGWLWGPRLLIPGVIPALASIASWADAGRARAKRTAVLLFFAFGALVSAPALVAPIGALLAQPNPPERGPSVIGTCELLPDAVDFTAHHLYERNVRDASLYLPLWQVALARRTGHAGALLALGVSVLLLLASIFAARGVRVSAQRAPPVPP